MAFARDRDLLVLSPNLLREARWRGQVMAEALDASVSGVSLTSASNDFEAAGVEAGAAALVGEATVEVVSRDGPTALTVSRVRSSESDPPSPPVVQGEGLSLVVATFGPQIEASHAALLGRAGLSAEQVVNVDAVRRVEALGALARIYEAAASGCADGALAAKAQRAARRFDAARLSLLIVSDLDGDGEADGQRAAGRVSMRRG